MNVLTEIINLLSDENKSLSTALLKLKVFSSRLNNKKLSTWIDKELNGYSDEDKIPNYRTHPSIIKCNYMNGYWRVTYQTIPLSIFPENFRKKIDKVKFPQDISTLESLSNEKGIRCVIHEATGHYIDKYYINKGNHYFNTYSVWAETSLTVIKESLASVRFYALNLVLKLEEAMGFEIEMQELIQKKEDVNNTIYNIMNQTVISNSGDGNIINTGDKNSIENLPVINKTPLEQLKETLRNNFVEEKDIEELEIALKDEPICLENKFGIKVNNWIKKMIGKAIDGTWQISFGTAGSLLADLITKYYN